MASKSDVAKWVLILVVALLIIWVVAMFVTGVYDLLFAWWINPLQDFFGVVESGLDQVYNNIYQVVDGIGTELGGLGGTVETNLASGIVITLGTAANDFINWFVGLFAQANQAFGGG